jgi:F-type H+-transporting ATPase subunit gamma
MANLREIRGRIKGVKSTAKITQAMKMVAAAKLRRAQEAILSARPYAESLKGLIVHLISRIDRSLVPLLQDREEVKAVLLVVVTADRGLCGAFNSNIIKAASKRIHDDFEELHNTGKVDLICIGKRGLQYFNKRDYNVVDSHIGLTSNPSFATVQAIVHELGGYYLSGEYDRVEIIYNEFKSVIRQNIIVEQMFPVSEEVDDGVIADESKFTQFVDYIYEPSEMDLIETLLPRHLNFQLWRSLLESNAAEQGARMTAMEAATSNAKDLISDLQLSYNRARQANITKEILEIVGGAEALSES